MIDHCRYCQSTALEPSRDGVGLRCTKCGYWVIDTYGRTYEQRTAARMRYKRPHVAQQTIIDQLNDAVRRDRVDGKQEDKRETDETARRLLKWWLDDNESANN